jgi:hypothetical protein
VSLLSIYLNDHLAGATVGLELARRTHSQNKETELGRYFERLVEDLNEDRESLKSVMDVLNVPINQAKKAAGWLAEKVGRLKFNGRLMGYSPLSRVEELEALCIGVEGKLSLWRTLKIAAEADERLAGVDLDGLVRRAEQQRADLERFRVAAATEAFGKPRARRAPARKRQTRSPRPQQRRRSPTSR